MVRIGSVVMQASDVRRNAEFWVKALGYVPRDGQIGEDWVILAARDGSGPNLALDRSDRMHLDLYTEPGEEQEAVVERLVELGARRVEWQYPEDADFVVLADPAGNLFCVVAAAGGG